jgi:hypothetical protein
MTDKSVIRAHLECAQKGYAVHVTCLGPATWSDETEDYYCHRCAKRVPFGLVCDPPGHDYYERDVAYLLELLEAERRANAHAIAELCGQVNSLRDCGQDRVCATPPGCCRHWEERNRELVGQLENALDASNEGAWMARALDAERELAAGRSEADRLTTSLRLANEAPRSR